MSNLWNTDLTDLNNFYGFTSLNLLLTIIVVIVFIIALVYFFKNTKLYDKHSSPLYFVILIIFTAAGFMYINRAQKISDLKADYEIAIGKIDKYIVTIPNKSSGGITCHFNYKVSNTLRFNQNSQNPYTILHTRRPNLKINYLVIYQESKPLNSYILLNYPIKDSIDFKKYQVLFEKEIPENVFRND